MKYLSVVCLILIHFIAEAQVNGNKQIVTKSFPIQGVSRIVVDLYASVEIDCSAEEKLTITADENLIELIQKSVENNRLTLLQKEWIQPSQPILIKIGAPKLERIEQSVHETTRIKNINRKTFQAMAIIGKLVLQGKVESLSVSGETGEVDAQTLDASNVDVNLWSRGKIVLNTPEKISGNVKEGGQVLYSGKDTEVQVRTQTGGKVGSATESAAVKNPAARYIEFKVNNNSLNRINCYVVGPKPDGSFFSYGFPMNPGQLRSKNWTVGSKVYRETKLGTRVLLVEIKAANEGQVVKLYGDK